MLRMPQSLFKGEPPGEALEYEKTGKEKAQTLRNRAMGDNSDFLSCVLHEMQLKFETFCH